MNPFRYKADIFPITLFTAFFALDISIYLTVENIIFLLLYTGVGIFIKAFICAWNHHHQHVQTFSVPFLNRILEIIYGFQTWVVGYAWVLHHNLGHHVHYQDQSLDESAWKSPEWKRYGPLMYTWIVSVTSSYRSWKVGKKYPQIQRYFLTMYSIQTVLLVGLIAYNPLAGILIFLLPMLTGILLTVYTTYYHHSGLESDNPYESSYNIVTPWYNIVTGNLGYHTAHHIKWGLHWSKLPEFHNEIQDKIDKKFYRTYNLFWYHNVYQNPVEWAV